MSVSFNLTELEKNMLQNLYGQLKEYLNFLATNGLIDYDSTSQTFRTSEKGLKFLKLYNEMGELRLIGTKTVGAATL